ncbi:hypothetical protein OF83DRAFT_22846 [Amylostereum chailletii]|nr:hypothetical protein OF83DRAFT_22846 [Amylostereum chailletii]
MRQIFAALASMDHPRQGHRPQKDARFPGSLGWVILSHVCRRWRSILLDMPSLWAKYVCALPTALDVFFERSRKCSLTIRFDSRQHPSWRSKELLQHVSPWFHRASAISVSIPERFHDEILKLPSIANSPILEDLDVYVIIDAKRKPQILLDQPSILFPFLCRLRLCDILLPWNASAVTALEICRSECYAQSECPDLHKFYACLSTSPNLETLAIENWLPDFMDEADLPILDFPFLSRLSVSAEVVTCHAFYRSLRIPRRAELNFNLTVEIDVFQFAEESDNLFAPVAQLLSTARERIFGNRGPTANDRRLCLSLEEDIEYASQIRIFVHDEPSVAEPFCGHPLEPSLFRFRDVLRIRLPEQASFLWSRDVLAICAHPMESEREDIDGWRKLFKIFPNVHTLFINAHGAYNDPQSEFPQLLVERAFLKRKPSHRGKGSPEPAVLPMLRYLWMHQVRLTVDYPHHYAPAVKRSQDLLEMLQYRAGIGLQHLRLGPVLTVSDTEQTAALREEFVAKASETLPIIWEDGFTGCNHALPWYMR